MRPPINGVEERLDRLIGLLEDIVGGAADRRMVTEPAAPTPTRKPARKPRGKG